MLQLYVHFHNVILLQGRMAFKLIVRSRKQITVINSIALNATVKLNSEKLKPTIFLTLLQSNTSI